MLKVEKHGLILYRNVKVEGETQTTCMFVFRGAQAYVSYYWGIIVNIQVPKSNKFWEKVAEFDIAVCENRLSQYPLTGWNMLNKMCITQTDLIYEINKLQTTANTKVHKTIYLIFSVDAGKEDAQKLIWNLFTFF